MSRNKSTALVIVMILGTAVMSFASYMLWKTLHEYSEGEAVYEELLQYIDISSEDDPDESDETSKE